MNLNSKGRLRGIVFKMAEQFEGTCRIVACLKEYLTKRGIQVSDQGRAKRKAELQYRSELNEPRTRVLNEPLMR